jgi:hypothetical protein
MTTVAVALALGAGTLWVAPAASAAQTIFTVAGTGALGFGGDGGAATRAVLNHPRGLAAMPDGGYLIADATGNRVRRVYPSGTIRTVAGTGTAGATGDGGPATAARLNNPHSVAILPDGGFLIADDSNHRIRKVSSSGTITTVAGIGVGAFGGDGGPATAARLKGPRSVSSYPDGSYLIADSDNNRIRRVSTSGIITTVAGTGTSSFGGDGGPAKNAAMNSPYGVATLPDGGYLIADADNARVRRVLPDGRIITVAGVGVRGFSGDGGPATAARITSPYNTAPLPDGSFLIADTSNNRVRQVNPAGIITTVAGTGAAGFSGDSGPASAAALNGPKAMLAFGSGFLIADASNHRVREVTSACLDRTRPSSSYTRGTRGAKSLHGRFTLRGTDKDKACGAARKVKRIGVSIERVQGRGRCRHLGSKGRLSKAKSCSKRTFLRAKLGSHSRWSFKLRRKLPRGRYLAQTRAIDGVGNLERRRTRGTGRNVIRFKVR